MQVKACQVSVQTLLAIQRCSELFEIITINTPCDFLRIFYKRIFHDIIRIFKEVGNEKNQKK